MPEAVKDQFFESLGEPWSNKPANLEITYVEAVGRDGVWVFVAEFDQLYEPGLHSIPFGDEPLEYVQLWDGVTASSAEAILAPIEGDFPGSGIEELAGCLDLSPLVDE